MLSHTDINFNRVAEAIEYLIQHAKAQPTLDQVAETAHISPAHFQRIFSEWVGTSPKQFLKYISVEHAKKILREHKGTLTDATYEIGLSSTSRLHDLFVTIEGMTPAEYKNDGEGLPIAFSFQETLFGKIIVASTPKGVCHMMFEEDEKTAIDNLKEKFPKATLIEKRDTHQQRALAIFQTDWSDLKEIKLHLKGTDFQLKIWEALLKIPMGELTTYGKIAEQVGNPKASRAVGTAIGSNPIAFLIPCHRVIQSSGLFGGYMWGTTRKTAIIGWEGVQIERLNKAQLK
jgi:AraC family transcriptional regulator of adaptative response/methylated-DNA-[protein]-cysteine methyltransferase